MKHVCGGLLIHPRWVLTAAHCFGLPKYKKTSKPENWVIVVGEYNQYKTDEGEQIIKPVAFYLYPEFNYRERSVFWKDIGLVKLNQNADLGPYAGLISIDNRTDIAEGTECQIGGWGQVSEDPYGWGMYIPLMTTVYSFNYRQCLRSLYIIENVINHMDESAICAGIPIESQSNIERSHGGVSDACQGDSGGPLICRDTSGEFVLSGIVSTGIGCGSSMYPGIYSKVSYFKHWIRDTMKNNESDVGSH